MKKSILTAVLLLAAALPAWAHTVRETLANGMTVVVREDKRAPVATVQLWYKVGSIDEHAGKSGLSHALEHMMFKGTPAVPSGEFARRISAMGGNNNAYTANGETVYHQTVAKQHLPEVLRLEADRMRNLNFSDTEFTNEMKVIREERRERIDDNPMGSLYEQLQLRAFDKPANRTTVIGTMADLHTLTANDLRRWYAQWYAPNNALLVIVGDVDAHSTIAEVKRHFAGIAPRPLPARHQLDEAQIRQATSARTTGNTKQPMFMLGYRVPHLHQLDDKLPYALSMLTDILDGHTAARFDKHLIRGQQLALEIATSYSVFGRQPQLLTIAAMPSERATVTRLRQAIEAQIADIAANGVGEDELQRARIREESAAVYARDSIEGQAGLIATLEHHGFNHADEHEIRQRIAAVTSADIQAAAKLLTDPRRQVFVRLDPRPAPKTKKR
ncbi:M16 family metallopeptidase [Conchiformibius kuhniae]|uniref:M16 family metallopeptidase n=1 Tax=Conchiformibius kuhniae TaxID=211502 RepID=A0A8T9MU53_9NEIS|nr:pitrilysin family protein [Conchiformibius kuhniae]UOP04624.1 insulinase family protein [Conchiformibius kuhniae]